MDDTPALGGENTPGVPPVGDSPLTIPNTPLPADPTSVNPSPPPSPILSDALPPQPPTEAPPPPPSSFDTPPTPQQPLSASSSMPPPPPPPPPSGEVTLPQMPLHNESPNAGGSHKKMFMVVGIALLLIILLVGGLFMFSQKSEQQPVATQPEVPVPTQPVVAALVLNVTSPQDGAVSTTGEIAVTGKATPGAVVVALTKGDQNSSVADANGLFSTSVKLLSGINDLTITAVDSTGTQKSEARSVIYDAN